LTHDRLLYVLQQQLGRIASMPATGHNRAVEEFLDTGHSTAA